MGLNEWNEGLNGAERSEARCRMVSGSRFLKRREMELVEMGEVEDKKETAPRKTWGSSRGGLPAPLGRSLILLFPRRSK